MSHTLPSQDEIKELLDYDYQTGKFIRKLIPELSAHDKMLNTRFGGKSPCVSKSGYEVIMIQRKSFLAHRLAWMYHYGVDPGDQRINHLNLNLSDNRIANLKLIVNPRKPPIVYKGVFKMPDGKWQSHIKTRGKSINLGNFNTAKEAALAYNKKAKEIHGDFADFIKI
jgi:hypothetical protein